MRRLEKEIQAFHTFVRPNQAESVARKHVIEQVRRHVREFLPGYVLEVFGSERTGIAFAASDIDLRLVPEDVISDSARSKLPPSLEERHRRTRDLRRLHSHLKWKHRQDYLLTAIRWARYPLISLQDKASGLDVQIVLSNDTSSSREFMQRYMDEYRYLLPTYSVIKAALDVRGLTDVFRGGIGSYSLFMMVVASIKHKPNPRNNAAAALHRFLGFWGNFKAEVNGVSIEPVELFNKSEQTVMHGKAMGHIKVIAPVTKSTKHTLTTTPGRQNHPAPPMDANPPRPGRRNQRPRTQGHCVETCAENLSTSSREIETRHGSKRPA